MEKKFYNVAEFIEILGDGAMSKVGIYRLIQKGKIPAVYLGSRPLIPAAWVEKFMKNAIES